MSSHPLSEKASFCSRNYSRNLQPVNIRDKLTTGQSTLLIHLQHTRYCRALGTSQKRGQQDFKCQRAGLSAFRRCLLNMAEKQHQGNLHKAVHVMPVKCHHQLTQQCGWGHPARQTAEVPFPALWFSYSGPFLPVILLHCASLL